MMRQGAFLSAGLVSLLVLAGCGNQTEISPVLGAMAGAAKALTKGKAAAAPAAEVTRADLAKLGVPVIKGEMKSGNATFYLVPIAVKGNVQTWSTSDDLTVTFRDGVMVETRGLGRTSCNPPARALHSCVQAAAATSGAIPIWTAATNWFAIPMSVLSILQAQRASLW